MANWCPLYCRIFTDEGAELHFISATKYSIPLLYRLAVCAHTETVQPRPPAAPPSLDSPEPYDEYDEQAPSFRGEFAEGKQAILAFMEKFAAANKQGGSLPEEFVARHIADVQAGIETVSAYNPSHFQLEPTEIFSMEGEYDEMTEVLRAEIQNIQEEVERTLAEWSKEVRPLPVLSVEDQFYSLGFGDWSGNQAT
ncbi:MAG: hypothetical protein Q4A92_08315 [Corynebacterium sp.]|nr:hypothetical protein [Corynebacterium sp.]